MSPVDCDVLCLFSCLVLIQCLCTLVVIRSCSQPFRQVAQTATEFKLPQSSWHTGKYREKCRGRNTESRGPVTMTPGQRQCTELEVQPRLAGEMPAVICTKEKQRGTGLSGNHRNDGEKTDTQDTWVSVHGWETQDPFVHMGTYISSATNTFNSALIGHITVRASGYVCRSSARR